MNENISKIHLDILDKKRQEVISKLQPITKDFILGGGTAIALQIKHRQSFDFDFFTPEAIPKNLLGKISKLGFYSVATTFDSIDELSLIIDDEVKVTFLSYPFAKIFDRFFVDQKIKIFSLSALAAQKSYTIGRRGVWRDYYDIFSLINHDYFTLNEIIEQAKENFGDIFNSKLFLSQLVYLEDIQDFTIEPLNNGLPIITNQEVKKYLEEKTKEYIKIL